jgi:NAD(P)-dependent dehydrogenase (short-subunit alcohol dehydrogenase family)
MATIPPSQTVVLVTGANQGLGFETVKKLAAEQANYTLLLASRDFSKGTKAAESISKLASNTNVVPIQLEVTSDDSIAKAVNQVSSKYGRLDVLFNNAGISQASQPTPRAEWLKIFEVNAISSFLVTEAFVPLLKKADLPRVVFMSSGLGSIGGNLDPKFPFYGLYLGTYSVSKAAMNMIGAQTAVKYEKDGFKVNIIDPGYNQTNLNAYNEYANPNIADGAVEACRIIVQGKDGQYSTYSSKDLGILPW